jgi:hypothetical protein
MAKISRDIETLPEGAHGATGSKQVEMRRPEEAAAKLDTAGAKEAPLSSPVIDDDWFIANLKQLRALSTYVVQEGIHVEPKDGIDPLDLRKLNRLRPTRLPLEKGRSPTDEEWDAVDLHRRLLFGSLTLPQRRRFTVGAVPTVLAWIPLLFAVIALASLISAVIAWEHPLFGAKINSGTTVLPFYLIWLMSLGAIGSVAFIGMNVLSVQEDITFDLTKWQLIMLRIVLGALFALVLTLPFGFNYFIDFCNSISLAEASSLAKASADQASTKSENPSFTVSAVMLVAPFIFGFSTSLVILILNRLVTAVQSFFGQSSAAQSTALPERIAAVKASAPQPATASRPTSSR